MVLNTLKCNHLTPLGLKGLRNKNIFQSKADHPWIAI